MAAAQAGSFTAAAEVLFLTPSAVSQQIALLERECGVVLFERSRRGVLLTEAGRSLLVHAEDVLARLGDAQAELAAVAAGNGGRLRFGSFPTATAAFAARAVAAFSARFPAVVLSLVDGEPYEMLRRLVAREIDLALVFDLEHWPAAMDYEGVLVCAGDDVELIDLFDDPFLLVLPESHRLARRRVVRVEQLRDERIIGSPQACAPWGADLSRACAPHGFVPRFDASYQSTDFAAQQAFVAAGCGLTLVPRLATAGSHTGVVVRPLEDGPVRHIKMAVPTRAYHSPAVIAMIEIIDGLTRDDTHLFPVP